MECNQQQTKARTLKLLVVSLVYMATTYVSVGLQHSMGGTTLYWLIAVTPVLPAAWIIKVTFDHVMALDELERRICLEAVLISAIATGLITMTWSFLTNAGLPELHSEWVFPMLMIIYGLAIPFRRRNYK